MLKVLAWKEWREQRPVVAAGCGIALAMPLFMMAGVTVTELNPTFEDVVGMVPIALFAFVWPLLAAAAGAITIATEVEEGTMRFLLSRPVSRSQVWGIKVALAGGGLAVIGVFSLIVIWGVNQVSLTAGATITFGSVMSSLSSTMYDPFTLASLSFLLFACSVFCSSVLTRPLTAAAAGLAMALSLLAMIFVVWAQLALLPRLEPQWLGIEVTLVAVAVLLTSMLVFTWAEVFGGPASPSDPGEAEHGDNGESGGGLLKRGRILAGLLVVFVTAIAALPMVFANATLAPDDARVQLGSISYAGNNVVMTVADESGSTTEIWLLHTDGSGLMRLTGRHTFAPQIIGSAIAYLSRRGAAGGRTGALDLRVIDRRASRDSLILRDVPGSRRLFYSRGSAFSRTLLRVGFSTGTELTIATADGRSWRTVDVTGTPLENAIIFGFTASTSYELLFLPASASPTTGGYLDADTQLSTYSIEDGEFRVIHELPAGTLIPAIRRVVAGEQPEAVTDISLPASLRTSGWRWLPVYTPAPGGMTLQVIAIVEGDVTPIRTDTHGVPQIFGPAWPCRLALVPPARSWRRDDGRRFRENQVLFVDCPGEAGGEAAAAAVAAPRSESGQPANIGESGPAIRLRGLESGDERLWRLPIDLTQHRVQRMFLSRAQDAVLLHVLNLNVNDGFRDSRAVVVSLDGGPQTFPDGFVPMGWIDPRRILLQSRPNSGEVTFAVGNIRTGQILELYPENEVAQQGATQQGPTEQEAAQQGAQNGGRLAPLAIEEPRRHVATRLGFR